MVNQYKFTCIVIAGQLIGNAGRKSRHNALDYDVILVNIMYIIVYALI